MLIVIILQSVFIKFYYFLFVLVCPDYIESKQLATPFGIEDILNFNSLLFLVYFISLCIIF